MELQALRSGQLLMTLQKKPVLRYLDARELIECDGEMHDLHRRLQHISIAHNSAQQLQDLDMNLDLPPVNRSADSSYVYGFGTLPPVAESENKTRPEEKTLLYEKETLLYEKKTLLYEKEGLKRDLGFVIEHVRHSRADVEHFYKKAERQATELEIYEIEVKRLHEELQFYENEAQRSEEEVQRYKEEAQRYKEEAQRYEEESRVYIADHMGEGMLCDDEDEHQYYLGRPDDQLASRNCIPRNADNLVALQTSFETLGILEPGYQIHPSSKFTPGMVSCATALI